MDPELQKRLEAHDTKLEAIYHSVEKTRKYFMWTLIISVAMIVLPLIGLAFVIPVFLKTLNVGALVF